MDKPGQPVAPTPDVMEHQANEGRARAFIRNGMRVGLAAAALGAATTFGVQEVQDPPHSFSEAAEDFADFGLAPVPPISQFGTEALIATNDSLREAGPYVLVAGSLLYGALQVARRRDQELNSAFNYLELNQKDKSIKARAGLIMPAIIIASIAVASGMGDAAGEGAGEPMRFIQEVVAQDQEAAVVVQHDKVIPFNSSAVAREDVALLGSHVALDQNPASVVPFSLLLGNVNRPGAASNPSSASIVVMPSAYLEQVTGENFKVGETCNPSVIVGEQLGAKKGDQVELEGHEATVVGTVDVLPGLDRVIAITSQEQLDQCSPAEVPYWGAVVLGEDSVGAQQQLDTLGLDYHAESFESLDKRYKDFWDRSVKPPMMELVLLAFGAGSAGLIYIRNSEVWQRTKQIATLNALGVQKRSLKLAENIQSLRSGLRGTVYGGVVAFGLTAMTNSSQYGLEIATDIRSLGAGFLTYLGVTYFGGRGAKKLVDNMDTAEEMRSN